MVCCFFTLPEDIISIICGEWIAEDKSLGYLTMAMSLQQFELNEQLFAAVFKLHEPAKTIPENPMSLVATKQYYEWIVRHEKKLLSLRCTGPNHHRFTSLLLGQTKDFAPSQRIIQEPKVNFSNFTKNITSLALEVSPSCLKVVLARFPSLTSLTVINDNGAITGDNFDSSFELLATLTEFTMIIHEPKSHADLINCYIQSTASVSKFVEKSAHFFHKLTFILYEPKCHRFNRTWSAFRKLTEQEPFMSRRTTTREEKGDGSVEVESTMIQAAT